MRLTLTTMMVTAIIAGFTTIGYAQEVTILPYPVPNVAYQALKQHLSLTDPQITALTAVSKARSEAQSALYRQINEKNTALNTLLNSGSTDAARIGQLMIEIASLRKQTVPSEPYRSQALGILSPDQKTKLPVLVQALQLQTAAYQATSLNLIDSPAPTPRVLPVDFGHGIGSTDVEQP
ncbi:MAG: hypothetical protein HY820_30240 [Acidobacteria bacterium]|nr:hypothetical protein [Acidobacteriota bacterium]